MVWHFRPFCVRAEGTPEQKPLHFITGYGDMPIEIWYIQATAPRKGYVYQEAATWVNYKTLISADCFY